MPRSPQCHTCRYCAHSPYLVCGIHPEGPQTDPCPDYSPSPLETQPRQPDPLGWHTDDWRPATYAGEVIEPSQIPNPLCPR